ncbi:helix-turn-helix transcriptional regulator [Streptomyces gilvus]|uniref:helix-turn-helix transcriptional regulator n=1 Tax=Streptomyces gilvus TaxID=2920937 RepID=UPI001F0D1DB7|nr:LuxR family transcriptional regulator [Streptomyces sp. CME 23]MCH5676884.1 AAA family ATPase [Streptomyces sp. CME 23]
MTRPESVLPDHVPAAPDLLGREAELSTLARIVDQAWENGTAVLMRGEAGIGKSSLLRAAADLARAAGFLVLEAVGMEAETRLPFAGLHQVLITLLGQADRLPEGQRLALLSAFGSGDGTPPEPFLIGLATLNLLGEQGSQQPVAILVDDAHWLDLPSQETLAFLARRIGDDPILIMAAIREGHAGPYSAAGLREVQVGSLDPVASARLLDTIAADLHTSERRRILAQAEGNPLALVELPAAWRSALPPVTESVHTAVPLSSRLERAFVGRIAELPSPVRDALLIAAVDYETDLAEILAAASVLAGRPVTVAALDAAATAGLIRFHEQRLLFRHPLVRSGILYCESTPRRLAANLALAEVLVDQPYRRTWHQAQGVIGPDDAIADALEHNHRLSMQLGSVTEAIAALERSAQLTTDSAVRGHRLLLAAEHAFGLGRADVVDRLLAAAGRNTLSDLDRARMVWLREIFDDGVPGEPTRVFELCETAERSARTGEHTLALNLLQGAALRCWWAETGPEARARIVAVTEQLDGMDHEPSCIAALAMAEPVLRSAQVSTLLARVPAQTSADPDAMRLLGMAAHAIGAPVASLDFLDRAAGRLREQGRLGLLAHVLTMGLLSRLEVGEWDRAATDAEEAARLARETGQEIWDTGTLALRAIAAALRGDDARARHLADQAEETANGRRLNDLLACVQLARGIAWLSTGEHGRAYEALRRLFDPADVAFHPAERYHGVMYLAEAAARAGCRDDAQEVVGALERLPTRPSDTLYVQLSYARAVLADDDRAETLFATALGQDLTRWPWHRARLELAYGMWLRRRRRVAESRIPLRSALTTLDLIGARAWADQARAELRAAGDRITVQGPSAAAALSPQELQIARLAAEGLSNKEIGEQLFLSPRTVGSHLYRIFPKLDITSRNQLAARLYALRFS